MTHAPGEERLPSKEAFNMIAARRADLTTRMLYGNRSFFVGPDGSKEGWAESDEWDMRRNDLIEWMNAQRYDDDSTALKWALVQFADENGEAEILRHSEGFTERNPR